MTSKNIQSIVCILVLACAIRSGTAEFIVSPPESETQEGNGALTTSPFNYTGGPCRYFMLYNPDAFSIQGPILIRGVRFRPNGAQASAFSHSFTNVEIWMSTTTTAISSISNQFNSNVGADQTLVRSGPLTIASDNITTTNGTKAFDVSIPFASDYYYDPSKGNLTLDIRVFSPGGTGFIDGHWKGSSPALRDLFADGSATASFGSGGPGGAVTQFDVVADADGDGLLDPWEEEGGGLDVNNDGIVDLDLYALGARPDHKDLFVEVDAMTGRTPSDEALDMVVAAFANAPVANPDGNEGIVLHVQIDETDIPLAPWTEMLDQNSDGTSDWPEGFDDTKAERFGTPAQRQDPNTAAIISAKKLAYRYCIFSDTIAGTNASGIAEIIGNDFVVSLGGWATPGGTVEQQAGTFMHELGHTLGLRHGGGDNQNYKPNYHSVMNYTFQTPKNWSRDWAPVFSSEILPSINELFIDESTGLGGDSTVYTEIGPPPSVVVPMAGPIDVNRDADATGFEFDVDINHVRATDPPSPFQVHDGFDDWASITLRFTNAEDFLDGVHLSAVDLLEMTHEDHVASNQATLLCDPCDLNCDSNINGLDIMAFIDLILDDVSPPCSYCAGDLQADGAVTEADVTQFTACLIE